MSPDPILIAGPTASGKSALAIAIAGAFRARGESVAIVNADSMQVYADLRIITARPTPEEEAATPHRLFGHVDGAVNYSAARYGADVAALFEAARGEETRLIFAGGTGLYFKALIEGLSDIPPVPDEVRAALRAEVAQLDAPRMHALLRERDPRSAARLRPSDTLRIMRALEVHAATGRSIDDFHAARRPGPLTGRSCMKIFLAADREILRARIDARFDLMMEGGALDEVAQLRERRLDPMLPVMRAHGVPGLIAALDGRMSMDEAIARGKADTRAYSKRQFTFFRHALPGFAFIAPDAALPWLRDRLGLT